MTTLRTSGLVLISLICLAFFLVLAMGTAGKGGLEWEQGLIVWLRSTADPVQWPVLAYLARDLTAIGGRTLLLLWLLGVGAVLWAAGLHRAAMLVQAAGFTGLGLAPLFKAAVGRARPELVEQLVPATSSSFPSGHAMNAMLVYLTLALVASRLQSGRAVPRVLLVVAVTLSVLVGLTRVYLGVHWPTDVFAGWALGATWATAWVGWAVRRGWLP